MALAAPFSLKWLRVDIQAKAAAGGAIPSGAMPEFIPRQRPTIYNSASQRKLSFLRLISAQIKEYYRTVC